MLLHMIVRVKVSSGFVAVFKITSNNLSVNPIAENFPYFLQLFEVILETTANAGETLTQSCAEKYEGVLALYRIKFD